MAKESQGIKYEVLDETAVTQDNWEMAVFLRSLRINSELRGIFLKNPGELLERLPSYGESSERSFEALRPPLAEVVALVRGIIPEFFPDEDPSDERFVSFGLDERGLFSDLVRTALFPPSAKAHVLARDVATNRAVGHLGVHVGRVVECSPMVPDPDHPFVGGQLGHAFVDPDFRRGGVFRGLMDQAVDFVRHRMPAFSAIPNVRGVDEGRFHVTLNVHPSQPTYSFLAGQEGEGGFFRRYGFESMGSLPPDHPEFVPRLGALEFFEATFPLYPDV